MAKLLQLLAITCLILLSAATHIKKSHSHTRANTTIATKNGSLSYDYKGVTPNKVFINYLVETQSQSEGVSNPSTTSSFACPSGYSFLSYADAAANQQKICGYLGAWYIARLQGGGSFDGPGYGCGFRVADNRALGNAICVKTTIVSVKESSSTSCPSGYDTPTLAEVTANSQKWCSQLGGWDIARIGVQGSMDGPDYGCGFREWDTRGLGNAVCVQRQIQDVKVLTYSENQCGNANQLTVKDVMSNVQGYCNSAGVGQWNIARLAGGASMDGPGYGCHVRNEDTRSLGNALCYT